MRDDNPTDSTSFSLPPVLIPAGGASARMFSDLGQHKLLLEMPWPDGKRTMIASFIRQLRSVGFGRFHLLLGTKENSTSARILAAADEAAHGRGVSCSYEESQRGTAGAVYAWTQLGSSAVVVVAMPDTFFDFRRLTQAVGAHMELGANITILATTGASERSQNSGKLLLSRRGTLLESAEVTPTARFAGSWHEDGIAATSAGAAILRVRRFNALFHEFSVDCPRAERDFHRDFVPWLLVHQVSVHAFDIEGDVMDLGTRDRYESFVTRLP